MVKFVKEVFHHFLSSNTFQQGASLAYYAVFSLLPMIMIIISVLGLFFGKQAVSGEVYLQLRDTLGNEAAMQIQDIIKNHHANHDSLWTAVIGFVTLALSASGMFSQVHNSLNSIWNIKAKPKSSILKYLANHFFAFFVLIFLFFTILISTSIHSFLIKQSDSIEGNFRLFYVSEHVLSFLITGIGFAVMFRLLGDAIVNWKVALLGGLITSILFLFGKVAIGMYIGHSHISTTFGSASVLALLMLWVYYTSQIIFLGASFVEIISNRLGYELLPNDDAIKIQNVEVKK